MLLGEAQEVPLSFCRDAAFGCSAPTDVNLQVIVLIVKNNNMEILEGWPISNLLHLMKNARSRIATGH
jgi:hypothetical protein